MINEDGSYLDIHYASLQSVREPISNDYGGRFIIELMQNGYDAHARETKDGEIAVCLEADEGRYGTLYVANKGFPFTKKNVIALGNIGQSDKSLGEAVGNRGLGFRSVLAIATEPEIYYKSVAEVQTGFDGFCFRSAISANLKKLIGNHHRWKLAVQDLPPLHIPIPIWPVSQSLWQARGATVHAD